jgi:hypothetical protein
VNYGRLGWLWPARQWTIPSVGIATTVTVQIEKVAIAASDASRPDGQVALVIDVEAGIGVVTCNVAFDLGPTGIGVNAIWRHPDAGACLGDDSDD